MRRVVFVLLCALSACKSQSSSDKPAIKAEPSAKVAGDLTITPRMPAVGTKWQETRKNQMKLTMTIDIGAAKQTATLDDRETTIEKSEVLGVEGKLVTKKKVTYAEKTKFETENGKDKPMVASPLGGRTYVLTWADGKVQVSDESGKSVSAEEDELVRKSHASFGKPDPLFEGMPEGALHIGDDVPKLKAAIQENLTASDDGKEKPDFHVESVKLASIERGTDTIGVFDVVITVQTPSTSKDPFGMKADLKGTMRIRAKDGWLTAMDLKGPLELSGRDPSYNVSGKGEMTMSFTNVY